MAKSAWKTLQFWAVATGIFEIFLIIHGAGSFGVLEFVMRRDGYYPEKTDNEKEKIYSLMFTSLALSACLGKVIVGILIDSVGNWTARLFEHIVIGAGLVLLMFATPENPIFFQIGMPLFSLNAGFIYSYYILVNLFPDNRGLLLTSVGAANSLAYIFYVYYKNMVNTTYFWMVFFVVDCLLLFRTFFLTPKSNQAYLRNSETGENELKLGWSSRKGPWVIREVVDDKVPGFFSLESMKNIFNIKTFIAYVWFFMLDMRMQTLVSEVEPWLRWATEGEPDAEEIISWSTEVFQYASMTGVISGPILGIFLDKVIIWIENSSLKINNRKINHQTSSYLVSLASMCVIGLVFALISWLLTLGKTGGLLWFIYIMFIGARNIFYGIRGIYIMSFSKAEYLGRIFSFMSFLQVLAAATPPLFTYLCQAYFDHNYGQLNWVLVGTSLLSGVLPFFWFLKNKGISLGDDGNSEQVAYKNENFDDKDS